MALRNSVPVTDVRAEGGRAADRGPIEVDSSVHGAQAEQVPNWIERSRLGRALYAIYPGMLVASTIALASSFLSQHYQAPIMLFALLLGMAFRFLHGESRCVAGIDFASRLVLRVGVGMLGVRITAGQIASLGLAPVITVFVGVISTIAVGSILARWLSLDRAFGVLSGGAVAICGASAAMAIGSVLFNNPKGERDTILVVVTVTGLSTLAMVLYPILAVRLGLSQAQAGLFFGGSIHDIAQVVGAGFMISPHTGDIATYVKLLRVASLAPVVLSIAYIQAKRGTDGLSRSNPIVPMFLVGFLALVALNSLHLIPHKITSIVSDTSQWCLVTAIAALGMKTSLQEVIRVGWRPIGLMVAETIWIGGVVLVSARYLV